MGRSPFSAITGLLIAFSLLVACGPAPEDLAAVDYAPLSGADWEVSTPEEQGLDLLLLAEMYLNAEESETLQGLLVIKNGYLIAEGYFNDGGIDQASPRWSATKSFTSALVGLALKQGCLTSVDQKMMDFFPEYAEEINDPRKNQITIRNLLEMRSGYPWDDRDEPYFTTLYFSNNWRWVPHLVAFPLVTDPGTDFNYSSLSIAPPCGHCHPGPATRTSCLMPRSIYSPPIDATPRRLGSGRRRQPVGMGRDAHNGP